MAGRLNQTGLRSFTRPAQWASMLVLSLGLAGCGGFAETFGLTKTSPDEFRVMSQEPLSLPPEFELRPPGTDGATAAAEREQTRVRAEQAVFGRNGSQGGGVDFEGQPGMSEGERALLAKAGAGRAPEDIRNVLNAEANQGLGTQQEEGSIWDAVMFWTDGPQDSRDSERERRIEALEQEKRDLEIEQLERELNDLRSATSGGSTPE